MAMVSTASSPTLWRTCRVLANRTRLKMMRLLIDQPAMEVSAVAARLKLPRSLTSEYLRALESRGLLAVRRIGRRAEYSAAQRPSQPGSGEIVAALRFAFKEEHPQTLFKIATAFTHPRRIEVFRIIQKQSCTLAQLRSCTAISRRALVRHLEKLQSRGFITCQQGIYSPAELGDALGRELARLTAEPGSKLVDPDPPQLKRGVRSKRD